MKIALGQIDMVWEEKEQSFQKAEQMIKKAAKKRADVILFPEMAFTGFSMNIEKIAEPEQDSLTRQQMERFARQYHVAIGYGWAAQGQRRKRSCTIYEDTSFFLWERRSILSKRERNRNRSFSWQDDRTFYML